MLFGEALLHLTRGLELLKALPDMPERTEHELALQLALGAPLVATSDVLMLPNFVVQRRAKKRAGMDPPKSATL